MGFSPNQVAIDRIKALLDDGEPKEVGYLIAHIEALIPTSEAVRDFLHMTELAVRYTKLDPSDPNIPYRARHWRSNILIINVVRLPNYERFGKQVRKVPSLETINKQHTTQQHRTTTTRKQAQQWI